MILWNVFISFFHYVICITNIEEVDRVEFLVMKFCIFTHILYKIELNAHVEK